MTQVLPDPPSTCPPPHTHTSAQKLTGILSYIKLKAVISVVITLLQKALHMSIMVFIEYVLLDGKIQMTDDQ